MCETVGGGATTPSMASGTASLCKPQDRQEALTYLHRKQGKLVSGELMSPDRVCVRDLFALLLEDCDFRGVAQAYIAGLKIKSILNPKTG
jgi:hypothetical protein